MKNQQERHSYNFRISKQDKDIITKLRNNYCVNIAVFLRKSLNDLYNKMKEKK